MGRNALVIGFSTIVALLVAWFVATTAWLARVNLTIVNERAEQFQFRVEKNYRVNGILEIAIWIEGADDYRWFLDVGYSPVTNVTYGILPAGIERRYPRANVLPEPIEAGDVFYVSVRYQYDKAFPPAAHAGLEVFRFTVAENGAVRPLKITGYWTAPKNFPEPQSLLDLDVVEQDSEE